MKILNRKLFILGFLLLAGSCTIEEQINPNNPAISPNPTKADLNNLIVGAQANMRVNYSIYVTALGTIARELYLFDADPRNTTDLIGTEGSLDNNSFYTTASWNDRYQTIKNCNLILEGTPNAVLSDEQKKGYIGFAKTLMAHQFLLLINNQNDNGIRLDVADPLNLGPIEGKAAVFAKIATLLDEGYTELNGAEFAFPLTTGFAGFDTPATFREFNRALAARVALYRGLYSDALTYLGDSFYDPAGDLNIGPKMVFTTGGQDILNNLFKTPQQSGDQIIVNNHFILDAESGDTRVTKKTALRDNPTAKSGLNGTHETRLYSSSSSPIDIIRNEELILINAECQIQLDQLAAGVTSLDIIRTAAGLNTLAVAKPTIINDKALLIDEMLNQRRYSFWSEGQRAIDLRRYNRLNDTYVTIDPVAGATQIIFTEFPIPSTEN